MLSTNSPKTNDPLSDKFQNLNYVTTDREIFPGIFIPKEADTINSPKPTKEINIVVNLKDKGLVVIVGCAHHGIVNLVNNAKNLLPDVPVYALVGGLHLKDSDEQEIIANIDFLKNSGIQIVAPNHCTGFKAVSMMAQMIPDKVERVINSPSGTLHTGMTLPLISSWS